MKDYFGKATHCISLIGICLMLLPFGATAKKINNGKEACENKNTYQAFLKGKEVVGKGLFTIYKKDNSYFFELEDTLLGRDLLLGSRVAELSSTSKVVAGEMRKSPILIRFSRDQKNLYMHQASHDYLADSTDAISISVKRNSITPILKTFPIKTLNHDSTAAIVDFTKFLSAEIPAISPFNNKYKAGKLEADATFILKAQAFPKNVEIKTQMSYSNTTGSPFLIVMNRSFLLLPKIPMRPRFEDKRVGYFMNGGRYFSSKKIGIESLKYISRFNIAPKASDLEKYKAGELVVPEKQIVFYIDNAFPETWASYIKAGVEDWQKAFEAIGFKDAIIAKPYPINDPHFNPEDIRYSCVRYIAMPKANSMGPRWIDPRSGEVIGGDVLWWHNVTELLRDWRFVQCAAADPAVRKKDLDIEILGEMIRYVAAHEVGHTLGLKHNMRASYAFPVDSLRSASFTQANGTTPSIMDYARFNYIAQPGDKEVRFTPPNIGPYDIFAIEWGYKPIYEAKTPVDEKTILNQWIQEKSDDLIYKFGNQQMGLAFDPSSQNEALGDDAIKASEYGVKNARYIMGNLVKWTTAKNEGYDFLSHIYDELIKQYKRYLGHVNSYLGGVYINLQVEGEGKQFYEPLSREKQEQAIGWLFNEMRTQHEWILDREVEKRIGAQKANLLKMQASLLDNIMSSVIFQRLELYHNEYSCLDYLSDLHDQVWLKTINKQPLNEFDRHLQANYVNNLMVMSGMHKSSGKSKPALFEGSLAAPNSSKTFFLDNIIKPLLYLEIERTQGILKKGLKHKDPITKAHYKYLYELAMKK